MNDKEKLTFSQIADRIEADQLVEVIECPNHFVGTEHLRCLTCGGTT